MSGQDFKGRVAIVTGAASGIGRAVAERFTQHGAHGPAVAERIRTAGGSCEFFQTDVASEENVVSTVQAIRRQFQTIDHLVNNAGMVLVKGVEECAVEEWDRVMGVNVKSIFLMVKYTLPALRSSPSATVVNVGSISGFVAQKGTPAYVASKGAVLMLSKALALDLAEYGIRVNCVCPGITDTPMFRFHVNASHDPERTLVERCGRVPLGRMLSPREIADAVLYLSSNRASGITGTELVVDAGYTATAEWSRT